MSAILPNNMYTSVRTTAAQPSATDTADTVHASSIAALFTALFFSVNKMRRMVGNKSGRSSFDSRWKLFLFRAEQVDGSVLRRSYPSER